MAVSTREIKVDGADNCGRLCSSRLTSASSFRSYSGFISLFAFMSQGHVIGQLQTEFAAQGFASSKNIRLNFAKRYFQLLGDLFISQPVKVVEDERNTLRGRQFLQC